MPELGTYGSVRGARSNPRPYRECRPDDDGATHSGAGVRKPPREETAGRDTWAVRQALWGFDCRR